MKQAINRTMRFGALGMKVACSGRLMGAEMPVPKVIVKGRSPCIPCGRILTTGSARQIQPTVRLALRFGSTGERCSKPRRRRRLKEANKDAGAKESKTP